jgi:hypothetical protein
LCNQKFKTMSAFSISFRFAVCVVIFLMLCNTKCKNDKADPDRGSVYVWVSDSTASFPVQVNMIDNGTSSGTSVLQNRLTSFNCNDPRNPAYVSGFAEVSGSIVKNEVTYIAVDKKGKKWTGSVKTILGCQSIELTSKNIAHAGAFFYSQANNIQYPIRVTIANRDSGDIGGRSKRTLSCDSALVTDQPFYWFYLDTTGTFVYHAKAASGETWDGQVNLYNNHCSSVELLGDTAAIKCTTANLTGNWVRQDDGALPNSKGMIIGYSQSTGGIVSFAPSQCCYKNTDIIWSIISANDCSLIQYDKNTSCQYAGNTNATVKFSSLKVITVNGVQYVKQ